MTGEEIIRMDLLIEENARLKKAVDAILNIYVEYKNTSTLHAWYYFTNVLDMLLKE